MNCLLCGRESSRPICRKCTVEIMESRPFLVKNALVHDAFYDDLTTAIENGLITNRHLEELNVMAKNAMSGGSVDYEILAKAALFFHRKYKFYLENFEIDEDYYLTLAEKFSNELPGEMGEYLLYVIYKERGNLKGALKIISSLAKEYGKEEYLLAKARLLLEMGNKDDAFIVYEELIKKDKSVWKDLGDALFDIASYDEAAKIYQRFVEEMGTVDYKVAHRLGLCMVKLGKYEDAIENFKKAISLNKYYLEAYVDLLSLYSELDMRDERKKLVIRMRHIGFPVREEMFK